MITVSAFWSAVVMVIITIAAGGIGMMIERIRWNALIRDGQIIPLVVPKRKL